MKFVKGPLSPVPRQRRSYALASLAISRQGPQVPSARPVSANVTSVSGLKVATMETFGPSSTLSLVIAAGSRFESPSAPGAAHLLKSTILRNVPGDSLIRTIREVELRGNALWSGLSREHMFLTAEFLRDDLVDIVPLLLKHAFNASYQPWEFLRGASLVETETAEALGNPQEVLFDALYSTAYRSKGLGNSLYAKASDLEGLTRKDLSAFAAANFTLDKMALVGLGVSHGELEALVGEALKEFSVPVSSASVSSSFQKCHYYGGETRIDAGTSAEAHYLLAYPSGSLSSSSAYPTSLVLKALLDGKQRIKYGAATGNACLLSSASQEDTRVNAFSTAHTDAGLLGFHVHGQNDQILPVLRKSLSALKSVAANGAEATSVERAKKAAIVDLEDSLTRRGQIEFAAEQLTANGSLKSTKDWDALVQKVSVADVQKLAKEMLKATPTAVAFGNIRQLPFVDQL